MNKFLSNIAKTSIGISSITFIIFFLLSGIIFPILGIIGIFHNTSWLVVLSSIFACYYVFINILSGRFFNIIATYIINLIILYAGDFSISENYSNFFISLIEIPILDYIYVIFSAIFPKKDSSSVPSNTNQENYDNSMDSIIRALMDKSNLSELLCKDVYNISLSFLENDKESAYNKINYYLIPHLKENGNIRRCWNCIWYVNW